jgi:hypothetical protein
MINMNTNMKQKLNILKFKTIKNSPEILMYAGAVGVVISGVMACKSTLKLTSVLEKRNETLEKIHEAVEDETLEYTKEDLLIVYTSTALDIAKIYVPSVILGGLSIAAMIQSHNILNKRNAALAAAFTTATESFNRYRKAVVDRYGERADFELRHGIKAEKMEVTETDENGKTKKKKETVDVAGPIDTASEYARFFDESCDGWNKDGEYNLMFLKQQQQYANDRLQAQGYLFLNDVYDMLGIPRSKAGQIVGWTYNEENPTGDNYVDFGIHNTMVQGYVDDYHCDTISEERRDFVNGLIPSILLDFNVDGNIWEKM